MAAFERARTSPQVPDRKKGPLHTVAGDCLIGYFNGMALLHLMEMSESGEDDLRKLIESTTAD